MGCGLGRLGGVSEGGKFAWMRKRVGMWQRRCSNADVAG